MSKYYISFDLISCSNIHIGSSEEKSIADDVFYRDTVGNIRIPGSSLAGALRFAAKEYFIGTEYETYIERLFGAEEVDIKQEDYQSSRITVNDAVLESKPRVYIRDGIKVCPETGTASSVELGKFDFEVLPPKSCFKVKLELNTYINDYMQHTSKELDSYLPEMIAILLHQINTGFINFGGKSARGLGRFKVKNLIWGKQPDIGSSAFFEMLTYKDWHEYIRERGEKEVVPLNVKAILKEKLAKRTSTPYVKFSGNIVFEGYFLTKDSKLQTLTGYDAYPLIYIADDGKEEKRYPYISGSTFRGLIRNKAKYILETLNNETAKEFEEQLFGMDKKGSRLKVTDLQGKALEEIKTDERDFIAIDRFTGGTINGAKYDAYALYQPSFNFEIILHAPTEEEIGLLLFVLRDLSIKAGRLGYGKSKGFGKFFVKDIDFQCSEFKPLKRIDFNNDVEELEKYVKALLKITTEKVVS